MLSSPDQRVGIPGTQWEDSAFVCFGWSVGAAATAGSPMGLCRLALLVFARLSLGPRSRPLQYRSDSQLEAQPKPRPDALPSAAGPFAERSCGLACIELVGGEARPDACVN